MTRLSISSGALSREQRRPGELDEAAAHSAWRGRPAIDPLQRPTHQHRPVVVGQTVGDAERLDPLLVGQQPDRSGPVGAPQTAIEAKGVENTAERVPEVFAREGLVRQGTSPLMLIAMLS